MAPKKQAPKKQNKKTAAAKKARKKAADVDAAVSGTTPAVATKRTPKSTAARTTAKTIARTTVRTTAAKRSARKAAAKAASVPTGPVLDALRVPAGPVDLSAFDTRATPGFSGGKKEGKEALAALGPELSDWQERLYAEGRKGGTRSVLLVLQGMDTSGKGGVIRHGAGLMDPQGLRIVSFKAPTPAERRRGFLWRIRQAVPGPGYIGIFDRSHYEDVLIARVRKLVTEAVWTRRYGRINDFEAELAANDVTVVKCFLHISYEEQRDRLLARLDDSTKHWKYNPADVDERQLWPAYTEAYEAAIERCNTDVAPWYVIPSDRKWYRNWAVTTMLLETMKGLDPQWPRADFDVDLERKRLLAS
ncbi:MAG TPA: polyphosphate kinase 2 family protein [Kribbellaceae bacterium]|nr:polyphosphate kinase 2 family protein [Kribbellaceae bacterium]